jgi:hypothetical protein
MQGLPNNIEYSNTYKSGPKDWVLLSGLPSKLLNPGTRFQERKGLSEPGNTVNV